MSCDVGHKRGSDPALLWLWRRPMAMAPIPPLAWEPPYAAVMSLEKAKRQPPQKKKKKKKPQKLYYLKLNTWLLKLYGGIKNKE